MDGAEFDLVGIYPAGRPHETLRLISDESGALALIRAEARYSGNYFHDPDDRSEGWYSFSVEWSRSGTIYPGGLRSNDLEATCAAVARWENSSDPEHLALLEDHRDASERAVLAAAEHGRLGDSADRDGALAGVIHALARTHELGGRLRTELEAIEVIDPCTRDDPEARAILRIETEALGVVCRQAVLAEATEVMRGSGVLVSVREDLLSTVAANLGLSLREVRALWPGFEAMEADVLLAVAVDGLGSRADDQSLITVWHFLTRHAGALRTPRGRAELLRELISIACDHNFDVVTSSMPWRNYVTCTAAAARTATLSASLTEQMQVAEETFLSHMGEFYKNLFDLVGYRLQPDLRGDYRAFALMLSSAIEGLGLVRRTVSTVTNAEYGTRDDGAVSIATLLVTKLVTSLVELDPAYDAEVAVDRLTNGLSLSV